MAYDPELGVGEVDRLSYDPAHKYKKVDLDAWAEQWFAGLASLDVNSEAYHTAERVIAREMDMHPDERESDARDLAYCLGLLSLVGQQNPYNPESDTAEGRYEYERWQRQRDGGAVIARQIVRNTLEGAEQYAALRVENEQSGTDYLTGLANRLGLSRLLKERYGISNGPVRRDSSGAPLPAIKLTHMYGDANRFKWINDTLGHQVGDAAIVETAWRARDFLRQAESPIIYRHGGDEFGAILAGLGDHEIEQLSRRLMTRQMERVTSPEYKYRESMAAVENAIQTARAFGGRIRAEARQTQLTQADIVLGKRPHYMLYINGEPVTELRNIIILSAGISSAMVSTTEEVERLRRDAEADMLRIRPIVQSAMDREFMLRPDTM